MKKLFKNLTKRLTLFILAIILIGGPAFYLFSLNANSVKAAWFDDNWAYRKAVTVTVTSSSSDITNLQTLITVDTSTSMSGKIQSSCQDLRFTSATGKQLPYYIDSGCATTSTKIWVMADLVPKNTTTYTMHMYYGNPSAVSGSNSQPYFDNVVNLKGYWTMNESSGATVKDSSITANNGTATGTTVTTHTNFSNARTFPGGAGDTDYVTVSDHTNLNPTTQITIEAWVYQAASQSDKQIIIKNMNSGNGGYRLTATTGGKFHVGLPTSGFNNNLTTAAYSTSAWHHVALTYDGANMKIYVDGQLDKSAPRTGNIGTGDGTTSLYFGRYTNDSTNANFNGNLDDVKIYSTARTAAQVLNDYNNTLPNGVSINIASAAVGTSNPSTSFATEEKAPSPVAYWKFDEGTGTTAQDSTQQNKDGAISGATWQTEDQCVTGKCLYFDGSNDVVTVSNTVSGIQTVSLWIKPITTSEQIIDINGTAYISVSSGTISATSFTSPTIYVNGKVSSTLTANTWQYVTVTTGTALSGSAIKIGQISTNYGQAFIDDVKLYPYARSASQVLTDYNSRGSIKGSSGNLSQNQQNNPAASNNGLVGYWKMDEASGTTTAADSSGNSKTGTSSSSTNVTTGKFGNARSFNGSQNATVSSLNLTGSAVSVSAWIKPNSATVTDFSRIISTSSSGVYSFILAYGSTAGGDKNKMRFLVTTANGAVGSVGTTSLNSTSTWYHVVGVYDGSKTYIYVNGVREDSDSQTGSLSNTSNNLGIGAEYGNTSNFDGNIDEARVYNRALSPADISNLYTFAPGPVGYWNFNENQGSSANDSSGNQITTSWNGTLGSQWKQGKYGSGGSFNRIDNYVKASAASSALKFGTGDFTVGAWVYFNAVNIGTGANAQSVIRLSYDTGVSADYISAGIVEESGTIYTHSRTSAGSMKAASNTISAGSWKYVTLVRSSSTVYGYIDGVPMSTTGTTGADFNYSSNGTVFIGGSDNDAGGGTSLLNGKVDEVKIYNYARTAKQIVEDMNAGHPTVGSPVGSAVGHWKFDEGYGTTANNSGNQGSTLNGSMSGFASPATSTSGWTNSGKFAKALIFDGTDDYVTVTDPGTSPLDITGSISVSAWVKSTTTTPSWRGLVTKYSYAAPSGTTSQGWGLFFDGSNKYNFTLANTQNPTASGQFAASTTTASTSWTHVVGTYDGTYIKIYINGILETTTTANASILAANTFNFLAGAYYTTNGGSIVGYFSGSMDEVKVYNYVLTQDEIKLDMNRSASQVLGTLSDNSTYQKQAANQEYCVPGDSTSCAAPVGRWDFEDASGTSAQDTSGNGFTGTLTNSPKWKSGKIGSGIAVDSTNLSYVSMGNINKTMYTLSAWFKPNSTVDTSNGGGLNNFIVFIDGSGHNADIWLGGGPTTGSCTGEVMSLLDTLNGRRTCSSSTTSISPTWNHLVLVWNSTSSRYDMYLNGQLQTVTAGSSTHVALTTISALKIGQRGSTPEFADSYGDFTIDQLRIYDYARSAAQIAWEYNQGKPVGHWKFDECQGDRVNDSSGNSNTGTITVGGAPNTAVGTCTGSADTMWKDGATGKYNSSLDFDGTDDYVNLTNNSAFQLSTGTISAWIKTSDAGSSYRGIVVKQNAFGMFLKDNVFIMYDWTAAADRSSGVNLGDGNWHHMACSFQSGTTNGTLCYIDGKLRLTTTITVSNQTIALVAAAGSTTPTQNFAGQIDDVQVYNYALTATQVKGLYNGGAVRFGPLTGTP